MHQETCSSRYGTAPGQEGDLNLPHGVAAPPVVVLLHGGFWRMPYGREQLDAASNALAARGYATWNLGYRRLGMPGVGWDEIGADVLSGIAHLAQWRATLDLGRVFLVGHSAGGQLALWAAAERHRLRAAGINVRAAIGLAAVSDLEEAWRLGLGKDVVTELLSGTPHDVPARCANASPMARLPLGVTQVLLHGDADDAVPVAMSRRYVQAARIVGDDARLHELPGIGHMTFLDPASAAFARLCDVLAEQVAATGEEPA